MKYYQVNNVAERDNYYEIYNVYNIIIIDWTSNDTVHVVSTLIYNTYYRVLYSDMDALFPGNSSKKM